MWGCLDSNQARLANLPVTWYTSVGNRSHNGVITRSLFAGCAAFHTPAQQPQVQAGCQISGTPPFTGGTPLSTAGHAVTGLRAPNHLKKKKI